MSHIFDALQRSDAEDSGADLSLLVEPTELLRRAELRVAARRDAAAVIELPETVSALDRGAARKPEINPRTAMAGEASFRIEQPAADLSNPFDSFQSLSVSITPRDRLLSLTGESSAAAEAFRLLGVRLRNLRRERQLKKILITSTIPREGKSTVATNLASTLARMTKEKVLLLEGDIRRPSLSQLFDLGSKSGICECISGECGSTKAIYRLEEPEIWILPAGKAQGNPLDLLQSGKLPGLMEQVAGWFDWVIIDSPPVLPLADTSVWARMADGVLLVTRQGVTDKKQLQRGIEALDPKKLIGALLNSCAASETEYYYYGKPSNAASADSKS
jgi:capsular exopolysaccharide synthesis family protein